MHKWKKSLEMCRFLTTPDFREEICGPLEVPPYKQTVSSPQGDPASHKTSAIYSQIGSLM